MIINKKEIKDIMIKSKINSLYKIKFYHNK